MKSYELSKPKIEFHVIDEMYMALYMCTCAEKTTFLGKDDYTKSGVGGGIALEGCIRPKLTQPYGRLPSM